MRFLMHGLTGLFCLLIVSGTVADVPLGLPELSIPEQNPQTPEKIELGERLFNDTRFSTTGAVSCATCHAENTAFTDGPLKVSKGIDDLTGTRNAPTVVNAAYNKSQFWDGRSPDLEEQALHPFLNPVEMGLPSHDPILDIVRTDADYTSAFEQVFGVEPSAIGIDHVTKAIAAFERTKISADSPFDHWYFGREADAISESAKRGFEIYVNQGRCVSCHTIEQDFALFTDHRFHNVGVGMNEIQDQAGMLASEFMKAKASGVDVDVEVLTNPDTSHLGRFAVNNDIGMIGAFKTPTLRNIAITGPYMHDGSLETLRDVVVHYNNGGVTDESTPVNDFLSGGIRPLNLTDEQIDDLVAFMETLTSPEYESNQSASVQGVKQ